MNRERRKNKLTKKQKNPTKIFKQFLKQQRPTHSRLNSYTPDYSEGEVIKAVQKWLQQERKEAVKKYELGKVALSDHVVILAIFDKLLEDLEAEKENKDSCNKREKAKP